MKTVALKISNIRDERPILLRGNYIVLFAFMTDSQIKANIEILKKALKEKKVVGKIRVVK